MDLGHSAADFQYLVRDRAGQFTEAFDAVLADAAQASYTGRLVLGEADAEQARRWWLRCG
jgi:hypothetical protein